MKITALSSALLLVLPLAVQAADPPPPPPQGWSGSGEAGLALASGNAKSENVNAKLNVKYNDDQWKDEFYLEALRNKATVTTASIGQDSAGNPTIVNSSKYDLTSSRYDAGASLGYKIDDKSYIVGALRYDHDAFSPYQYQYTASIGYGYQVLKNASDELAFEAGPGYKVIQPITVYVPSRFQPDSETNIVFRGKAEYKHNFNDVTSFVDTFLVEAGSDNTFAQNDAGIQVKMSDKLALKAGYEVRHNTDVTVGFKKTDQLVTTNLVYGF